MASAKTLSAETIYDSASDTSLAQEVRSGLTASPKTLSPWLFYDARGSELFEQITQLPEYYLTRTERAILAAHAPEIISRAAGDQRLAVVELGAGTASKTGLLLAAAAARQRTVEYYPIDVSETALAEAKRHLERELPGVHVHPRVADYTDGFGRIDAPGMRKLVLYIGSSIGNFEPGAAGGLLQSVRAELSPGDFLLLGADQVKREANLLAAYDDAQGVTAAFNENVLRRINRELDADFHLDAFKHQARWNAAQSRIEMHLRSLVRQTVSIPPLGLAVKFEAGETIHTENSYKFTDGGIFGMLAESGFALRNQWRGAWKDEPAAFAVYLAEAS
jgi:L-histidine N-alpha-methyltransferase